MEEPQVVIMAEDELQLTLGLSIGGNSNNTIHRKPISSKSSISFDLECFSDNETKKLCRSDSDPEREVQTQTQLQIQTLQSQQREMEMMMMMRREVQALRRQEAKRKRGDKKRGIRNRVHSDDGETEFEGFGGKKIRANPSFSDSIMQMQQYPLFQDTGFHGLGNGVNGVLFPYQMTMNTCWGSGYLSSGSSIGDEKTVFQPIPVLPFRYNQMKNPHFSHNGVLSALGGYDFDGNGGESSGGSSSGISDNRNASQDGENCNEIRSHSSHSPVELPKPDYVVGNSMQEKSDHSTTTPQYPTESPKSFEPHANNSTAVTAFSGTPNGEEPITSHPTNKLISVGEESSRHSCGNTINKPPHPNTSPQTRLSQIQSIMKMPCVSTKGDGPNGKTVSGFLHNFTKTDQVTIICVCHGSSFSPAEFVKHAGGTDVSNPLKHIVVNPTSSLR